MYNLQQGQHFLGHIASMHIQIYLPICFPASGNFERFQVPTTGLMKSLLACYAMTACDKYLKYQRKVIQEPSGLMDPEDENMMILQTLFTQTTLQIRK
jgi:hypothetical protein